MLRGRGSTIPLPPADHNKLDLPLVYVKPSEINLYRCHRKQSSHLPASYNFSRKAQGRFNAPNGEYGTLYLGMDPYCAFIEGLGSGFILGEERLVSQQGLKERCICHFRVDKRVERFSLVNLTDGSASGYGALNLDNQITTTKDREITKKWGLAFWSHKSRPDGILYRACNDADRLSIAMFSRTGDVFSPSCDDNLIDDPYRLGDFLDHYNVGIDDEVHDLE